MNYDPLRGIIQITPEEARQGALYMLYAIKKIKQTAGVPLTPYKSDGVLSPADHAMHGILNAASIMGIDLGAQWGNEIDSTHHN